MKTTYIYLNTYPNNYFYVGSHTWDGPEGVLDPNYHGSSHVAKRYGWLPVKEEILEVVTKDRRFIAEREWIIKYCNLFGIAKCALNCDKNKNIAFTSQYKVGRMLNLHSNSGEQLYYGSKRSYGRSLETRKKTGGFDKFQEASVKSHTDTEIARRCAAGHDYKTISIKMKESLSRGVKRSYHRISISNGIWIMEFKSVTNACSYIGHPNWARMINKHLSIEKEFKREGFVFKCI